MNQDVLKYCERILRLFLSDNEWSSELTERVHGWLVNGEFCEEKEIALQRVFFEMMDGEPVESSSEESHDLVDREKKYDSLVHLSKIK